MKYFEVPKDAEFAFVLLRTKGSGATIMLKLVEESNIVEALPLLWFTFFETLRQLSEKSICTNQTRNIVESLVNERAQESVFALVHGLSEILSDEKPTSND